MGDEQQERCEERREVVGRAEVSSLCQIKPQWCKGLETQTETGAETEVSD